MPVPKAVPGSIWKTSAGFLSVISGFSQEGIARISSIQNWWKYCFQLLIQSTS